MSSTRSPGRGLNQGIQVPSSMRSLSFAHHFNHILGGIPSTEQPAKLDVWKSDFNQSIEGTQSLVGIPLPSSFQSFACRRDRH